MLIYFMEYMSNKIGKSRKTRPIILYYNTLITTCSTVTFADFLRSNYRLKQLIKLVQFFLLVNLLIALFLFSLSNLHI